MFKFCKMSVARLKKNSILRYSYVEAIKTHWTIFWINLKMVNWITTASQVTVGSVNRSKRHLRPPAWQRLQTSWKDRTLTGIHVWCVRSFTKLLEKIMSIKKAKINFVMTALDIEVIYPLLTTSQVSLNNLDLMIDQLFTFLHP